LIDITVSLISLDQYHDLKRLLPSLMSSLKGINMEILLVDNRSTDNTREFVLSNYPCINVIVNSESTGYGENHNINIKKARGRYVAVMNTDMTVDANVFKQLSAFMDEHPDIGIVSPKILNPDGSIQGLNKRYPTIIDLFLRRFWPKQWHRFVKQRLDYYEMRDVGYDNIYDVPFLSGAFMFCRADLLKSLGGFDLGFFLYFEDVDLCRRVQKTHRTVYYPGVTAVHYWKRSSHKKLIYLWTFMRSAARYFGKWGIKIW